ncbi:MAG TPA: SAF domain-containing protein [Acidimicrobiales bacterium]|nr:SAF domain-containing protein [Acidimicrobiales bacterium]
MGEGRDQAARPLVRVDAAGGRRRSRISELVVGVVVVSVFGLGVVLWHTSSTHTESVLVLARSVRAGEPLQAGALTSQAVQVGAGVDHVPTSDASRVVGKVARADLAAGTLVSPGLFVAQPAVPAGSTVVAAALVPGQFPTFGLRAGQVVTAIRTANPSTGGDTGAVLASATVFEIHILDDTAKTWIVSLLVPESAAAPVASAAAAKSLSLALVPGSA